MIECMNDDQISDVHSIALSGVFNCLRMRHVLTDNLAILWAVVQPSGTVTDTFLHIHPINADLAFKLKIVLWYERSRYGSHYQ